MMDPRVYQSLDLLSRIPGNMAGERENPAQVNQLDGQPSNAVGFDRIDHFSYIAPPTSGVKQVLFTVGQDVQRGLVTGLGIGSTEHDWFGTHTYCFVVNDAPPTSQQFGSSQGGVSSGTFFRYTTVGTLQRPKWVNIAVRTNDRFAISIAPSTVPIAGTVVYNIWVRTVGVLFR